MALGVGRSGWFNRVIQIGRVGGLILCGVYDYVADGDMDDLLESLQSLDPAELEILESHAWCAIWS